MGEFIYAGRPWPAPFGPVFACSNPFPADLVFCTDKRNRAKEKRPRCVGLRLLCALQSGLGSGYALRHAPHYSGPAFQCSTTQKGMEGQSLRTKDQGQKIKIKIWKVVYMMCFHLIDLLFFHNLIRREGAPPTAKPIHSLLTGFCGRRALAAKGFPIPYRLAKHHREPEGQV